MKLVDLESKHVAFDNTARNKNLIELGKKAGYDYVLLGTHRGFNPQRIQFEINRINEMAVSGHSRPVRIVICSNGKVFIDNTHWALAYIKRYGIDTQLNQLPFYIVDFSGEIPLLVNVNGSVIKNENDMKRAVNAAGKVEQRVQRGWRPESLSSPLKDLHFEIIESFA